MPRRKFDAWAQRPHSKLAVVGASGWIGSAFVDQALAAGFPAERMRLFSAAPRPLTVRSVDLATEPLAGATLGDGDWLVVHAAIIGADRVKGGDLNEVRRRNEALLDQVLNLTRGADIRRLVMMSSGAAHRPGEGSPAKAAYSRLKRDQEDAVRARADCPVLLPRVFNLGGPYMTHPRNYALGDFIISLAKTGRVAIGAPDPVARNYVQVQEMAGVLLDLALDEAAGPEPFDIGGTEAIELGDLARRVGHVLGIETVIERPDPAGGAADYYVGDGRVYQQALLDTGRTPIGLDQIIADTVAWLRLTGEL